MKKLYQAAVFTLFAFITLPVFADDSQATTSVPLQVIPNGTNNYKVGISVSVAGGPPSLVTFDTGGVGLHIFASQVGNQNIRYTNKHINSSFGDSAHGFSFEGVIAYAPVTIGGVTTKQIPILVIQNVKCRGSGACNFNMNSSAPPMFGQFYGEMGVGMLSESEPGVKLTSPLSQLPGNYGTGFIIQNLNPQSGSGELVLGLTQQNTSGFNMVNLPQAVTIADGQTLYNDKSLQVQYQIGNVSQTMRTAFDTGGNYQINLYSAPMPGLDVTRKKIVRPGLNFDASLANAFDWNFTITNRRGDGIVALIPPSKGKCNYVNTGIGFFFTHNVIYDYQNGRLGFESQD